jgi:hypothetical protein
MELIFDPYKIPSCVLCLTFFSSLSWMFISRVSMQSPNYNRFCLLQLLHLLLQQEFVSFGIVLISIILDLDRHLSFIHCRMPYHPFATSSCTIILDMNLTLRIHTRWIPFSCISFCLGRKDGGCSSVLDPLPCSLCSLTDILSSHFTTSNLWMCVHARLRVSNEEG